MRARSGRLRSAAVVTALLASCLLAAWWATADWRRQRVANHLAEAISRTADEQQRSLHYAELLALGRQGLSALVDLLASSHEQTAQEAAAALNGEIERWRRLTATESTPRAAALAHLLAQRAGMLGSRGDRLSKQLALELLDWPADRRASVLVADCEKVLRVEEKSAAGVSTGTSASSPTHVIQSLQSSPTPGISLSVDLPGGDLPLDIVGVPGLPGEADAPPAPQPPRPLKVVGAHPLHDEPPQSLRRPYAYPVPRPPRRLPPEEELPPAPQYLDGPPALSPLSPDDSPIPPAASGEQSGDFDDAATVELMSYLHDDDAQVRAYTEDALRRQGFDERQLGLARRLTSPDVEVRLDFVSLLPCVPQIDPRPWLLWLSRDPDERVRRAALAVMATTRDPHLLDQVRRQAPRPTQPKR